MLVVQAMLFVWVASRTGPTMPGQPPERFARDRRRRDRRRARARPGARPRAVHARASTDATRIRSSWCWPTAASMTNGGGCPTRSCGRCARSSHWQREDPVRPRRFRPGPPVRPRRADGPGRRGPRRPGDPARLPPPDDPGVRRPRGPGGPDRRSRPARIRPWPIVVNGTIAGRRRRPAAAAVRVPAGAGTRRRSRSSPRARSSSARSLATLIIFGPARRRLRAVEDAARRFGAGDLTARAPGSGRRRGGGGRRRRSTRWPTIWRRAPTRWPRRIARGGSCSPTSRTS